MVDCKTVGFFFSKSVEKSVKRGVIVVRARARRACESRSVFSASFQTFCLTARAFLNRQKFGLFCSLPFGRVNKNYCIVLYRLLQRVGRMEVDCKLTKLAQPFKIFIFHDVICLIYSSHLERSILYISKGTK